MLMDEKAQISAEMILIHGCAFSDCHSCRWVYNQYGQSNSQ